MMAAGEALINAAGPLLAPEHMRELDYEGDAEEFGQYLCETMALFGTSHLHCLGSPDKKILFLQQACSPSFIQSLSGRVVIIQVFSL